LRILFYYPSNKRTIPIDVPLKELKNRGHQVFLLTTCEEGVLHQLFQQMGIETYSHAIGKKNFIQWHLSQILFLRRFCADKQIDVVHSHLQQTNLIATLAAPLMKTRVIVFRHHGKFHHLVDDPKLQPHRNEVIADKIINKLAGTIAVPGEGVKQLMLQKENVQERKVKVVPYIYNFEEMAHVNAKAVQALRAKYNAQLLLIMVSRLTPYKRHSIVLPVVHQLINEGYDIKMMIMDEGPEKESIIGYINEHQLQERIVLPGFVTNILEYIAAADVLIHPSLTDASNSAVKEAGLLQKAVIVCQGVGDFDDYIRTGQNGYALAPATFDTQLSDVLRELYNHPATIKKIGSGLQQAVTRHFSINSSVVDLYEKL